MAKPEKLRIPYEDFDSGRFNCVGRLSDGTQFMAYVTAAWPKGREHRRPSKRWIAVLHLFDAEGNHLRCESRIGGFDAEGYEIATQRAFDHLDAMLLEMSPEPPEVCDIQVRLFEVEIDGIRHGLLYERDPDDLEEEDPSEWVMLEPGDIMFHKPWDSGDYST